MRNTHTKKTQNGEITNPVLQIQRNFCEERLVDILEITNKKY